MNRCIVLMCSGLVLICNGCAFTQGNRDKLNLTNEPHVKQLSIQSHDDKKIAYDLYERDHDRLIVIAPGFYNSKQTILFQEMAMSLNVEYDVLIIDFRGHGKSRGLFTWTKTEFKDLQNLIKSYRPKYQKIGLIGFSLGAATSIIAESQENNVDSLIIVSAPSDFDKIDFHFWRFGFFENLNYNFFGDGHKGKGVRPGWPWSHKIKPIDVIDRVDIPKLFVHGSDDWLIRPWHTEKLYDKALERKELKLVPGGSHAEYLFKNDKVATINIFRDWFARTLN